MDFNYAAAAPEIFLGLAICVVLLVDVFLKDEQRETTYVLAMLALIGTAAVNLYFAVSEPVVTFNGAYIAGERSIADPYLFVMLRWAHGVKIDLTGLDNLKAYYRRMRGDAGVARALEAEEA